MTLFSGPRKCRAYACPAPYTKVFTFDSGVWGEYCDLHYQQNVDEARVERTRSRARRAEKACDDSWEKNR